MCRTQSMAWGAMLHLTITSACTNRWTIKRQQASTGTAKPWRQRPPSIDRRVVLTLGSTLALLERLLEVDIDNKVRIYRKIAQVYAADRNYATSLGYLEQAAEYSIQNERNDIT